MTPRWLCSVLVVLPMLSTGCVKKIAVNSLANALSGSTGGSFTQDDDLQFEGQAIPFALKLMESVAQQTPKHEPIRESLCSGFTEYALVYVKWPADQQRYSDYDAYQAGHARTKKMLQRAERYCWAAWDLDHPGFSEQIKKDTDTALKETTKADVPLLYWTAGAWLSEISLSKEDPEAIGELPIAAAMVKRALALDESWDKGSLEDLMIQLEPSLPQPGGLDRARKHFERAVELSKGTRASPYVSMATSVSVETQDRKEFEDLLSKALKIDASKYPDDELANLYAQEQARFYLAHVDDLFL